MSLVKMKFLQINLLILHILQGPKNPKIFTCPPALLHLSYSLTKKDNPLALTKFFLVRTTGSVDSLDSVVRHSQNVNNGNAV